MSQQLSDEEINAIWGARDDPMFKSTLSAFGMDRIRAIIAADRAKRVPMTHAQRVDVLAEFGAGDMWDFFDGIRAAEAFHGIGSKT